eukprot:PhF_6_TR41310/c0_g1_i3/m.62565
MKLSDEQQAVVNAIVRGENVVVRAVAGSGKTTTAIEACRAYVEAHCNCLIVTYNKLLKNDVRDKLREKAREDPRWETYTEAHNFHALCNKYLWRGGDNTAIIQGVRVNQPLISVHFYSLIIVDEVQDMDSNFYELLIKIIRFGERTDHIKPVFLLLGDPFQQIYAYRGASLEYMLRCQQYFGPYAMKPDFTRLHLSYSYRISHEMAAFINTYLNPIQFLNARGVVLSDQDKEVLTWWEPGISASPTRSAEPASFQYLTADWSNYHHVSEVASNLFDCHGNTNFVFLVRSTKPSRNPGINYRTPLQRIVADFGKGDDENWYVPIDEDFCDHEDVTVTSQKRRAYTFHAFKGKEADAVLVLGLDAFLERYDKLKGPLPAFNAVYVACTRARTSLVVVQWNPKPYITRRLSMIERGELVDDFADNECIAPTPLQLEYTVKNLLEHNRVCEVLDCVGTPGGVDVKALDQEKITGLKKANIPKHMITAPTRGDNARQDRRENVGVIVG